jgi:RNA polymerase sigma-70 factor (ECF subfamily)
MEQIEENSSYADNYHRLLYQNQGRIYAYVLSLVGNYADSDDIMQDTISIMWRRFKDFELGSDFVAWGIKIAHFKILDYRRRQKKHGIIQYNDDTFKELPSLAVKNSENLNNQTETLKKCLKKLKRFKEQYYAVISLKFFEDSNTRDIAERVGVSVSNVYKLMSRAYGYLLVCMKK